MGLRSKTIDKTRAHYKAETNKMVQLMRGIYANADINGDVLRHAVRIAACL